MLAADKLQMMRIRASLVRSPPSSLHRRHSHSRLPDGALLLLPLSRSLPVPLASVDIRSQRRGQGKSPAANCWTPYPSSAKALRRGPTAPCGASHTARTVPPSACSCHILAEKGVAITDNTFSHCVLTVHPACPWPTRAAAPSPPSPRFTSSNSACCRRRGNATRPPHIWRCVLRDPLLGLAPLFGAPSHIMETPAAAAPPCLFDVPRAYTRC